MSRIFPPYAWLFAGLAAVGAFFGRPEGVFLGVGLFVLTVGLHVIRMSRNTRDENPLDRVSNDDRSRLAPVYKAKKAIEEAVQRNPSRPAVKVIGAEAVADAERILEQSIRLLNIRAELRRAKNSQVESDGIVASIQQSLDQAVNEPEREMLQGALEARELQQTRIREAEAAMSQIDARLVEAAAALSELKTRILMAAADDVGYDSESMRESISNLEALSESFDEAEAMMRSTN